MSSSALSAAPGLDPFALRVPSAGALLRRPRVEYVGTATGILGLVLKNVLLTLLTLGIYLPWAKTELRRYMWAHVRFGGSPLEYTGHGMELLRGYVVVGIAFVVAVAAVALGQALGLEPVGTLLVYGLAAAITPFALFGSRRYLLSRTRWRGVAFGLEGRAADFARMFWIQALLVVVTLGIWLPVARNRMRAHLTDRTRYGTEVFAYDGKDGELFWMAAKGVLLGVLTFGLYAFWYQAEVTRYVLAHTRLQGVRLRSDITGVQLLGLALVGLLVLPLTLGLAYPWYVTWQLQQVLGSISLEGDLDLEVIGRGLAARADGAADGAADFLDADFGL